MKNYFLTTVVVISGLVSALVAAGLTLSYLTHSKRDSNATVVSRVYQHSSIPAQVSVLYDSADSVEVDFEQRFGRLLQALEWRSCSPTTRYCSTVTEVTQAESCRVLVANGRSTKTVVVSFLGGGCQVQGPSGLVGQVSGTDEIYSRDFLSMLQRLQKPVARVPKRYF